MEQLLTAFGIDVKLIIIQIINFVVLAAALTYLLYKPVLKILSDREEKIAQGIRDAEESAKARESAEADRKEVLAAAHAAAEDVHARAKVQAEEQASGIVAGAEDRAQSLVKNATEASEQLKEQARAESEKEVAQLAVLAAEKIMRERAS